MFQPDELVRLLKRYTFYTVGCTDPVAIALATSRAAALLQGPIRAIDVVTDKNIYKNSFSVGIPGTGKYGLHTAAALGAVVRSHEATLTFLTQCGPREVAEAQQIVDAGIVRVRHDDSCDNIYVQATVTAEDGTARAVLSGEHDRLVLLELNGEVLLRREAPEPPLMEFGVIVPVETPLSQLVQAARELDSQQVEFLLKGLEINLQAAQQGIEMEAGLAVGARIAGLGGRSDLPGRLIDRARAAAAAATDARMAGLQVPIVGCFGSGTHGAILFNTIGVAGRELEKPNLEIGRALALGITVLGCFKNQSRILTPHCGTGLDAGAGAAAGVAYLLGATPEEMEHAIHYVVANHYGTVCDGAKPSCAIKIGSAAGIAVEGAWLAKHGLRVAPHGVIGSSFNETLKNVGKLTREGLARMDETIVQILQTKQNAC